MTETRAQLASAMTDHALAKLANAPWKPFAAGRGDDWEIRRAWCGEFMITQTRRPGWQQRGAMLDVHHGKKVLALRDDGQGWQIVSFKRGDWEAGFLLT